MRSAIVSGMYLMLAGLLYGAAALPTIEPTLLTQAPIIDGNLSDDCWKQAARASNFTLYNQEQSAQAQTEVLVGYDAQALYLGWRCRDTNAPHLKANVKNRDGAVHTDDAVELFLAPGTDGQAYYHFVVNSLNVQGDKFIRQGEVAWDGDWTSATQVGNGEWTVEMAIPWCNFGELLSDGPWRVNFCREKWTAPQEISSWSYSPKGFHQPDCFGALAAPRVDLTNYRNYRILDLSVESYTLAATGYAYQIKGRLMNRGERPQAVRLEAEDCPREGKPTPAVKTLTLPARTYLPFELTLTGIESLGPRRLKARLRNAETQTPLCLASLGEKSYPKLMKGYLDRTYYTRETTGVALIALMMPEGGQSRLTAQLEIRPTNGPAIRAEAAVTNPANTAIPFEVKAMPNGIHEAVLRVVEPPDRLIAEETVKLRKYPPAPAGVREVKADRERLVALADGQPLIPVGIYGVPTNYMAECAQAGFNCSIRWDPGCYLWKMKITETRAVSEADAQKLVTEYLDACQRAGLGMLENITGFEWYSLVYRNPNFNEDFARCLTNSFPFLIESVRNHPALLAHYNLDEPSEVHRGPCRQMSETFWALDPYHPSFVLYCRQMQDWPEVYDIAGIDWYFAAVGKSLIGYVRAVRAAAKITQANHVPFWMVPQAEVYSGTIVPISGAAQIAQSYLTLIAGANGILWFTWPPRHQDVWAALKKVAGEFKTLTPTLAEKTPPQEIHYEPVESAETVQVLVKEHNGKTCLITANADKSPVKVTFKLSEPISRRADVLFESRSVKLVQGTFSDAYAGFERHVYEWPGSWPAGGILTLKIEMPPAVKTVTSAKIIATNLICNPGFETDADWAMAPSAPGGGEGTVKIERGKANSEQQSATLEWTGGQGEIRFIGKNLRLQPNTRYRFGGYGFAMGGKAMLYLESSNAADDYLRQATTLTIPDRSPGWNRYGVTFETHDQECQVHPVCALSGSAGTADFDDLFLEVAGKAASRNLLSNSGFEKDFADLPGWPYAWNLSGSTWSPGFIGALDSFIGIDTGQAFEGKRSLKMTKRTADDGIITLSREMRFADATKRYTHSFYMKADRPDLDVYFIGGAQNTTHFKVATEWKRYSLTVYEKPGPQRYLRLDINLQQPGTLWVDAAQFEEGTEATSYVPGDDPVMP